MAAGGSDGKRVVAAALVGNLLIAIVKFVAAIVTHSSAMLTEGVHSLVDTGNQLLLFHGMRRARRPADALHPFGYGRELYFWSFVVALLLFSGGAGVSIYEGIVHLRAPEPIDRPLVNFIVLAFAFLFEGGSWWIAFRSFSRGRGSLSLWRALRASKDPSTFVVLCEDSAALAGILIAAGAITLAIVTGNPRWDGLGSILIGILLAGVALVLVRETKGLLIGERASPMLVDAIRNLALDVDGICAVTDIKTVHLAPDQVVGIIDVDFDDDLKTGDIESRVKAVEQAVQHQYPQVTGLFIRPRPQRTGPSPASGGRPRETDPEIKIRP